MSKEFGNGDFLNDKECSYFEEIYKNVPVGIAIVTKEGYVIHMNSAMMSITGWTPEDFNKFDVEDYYYNPKERNKVRQILEKEGKVENVEIKLLDKAKKPYWASVSVKPISYKGRKVLLVTQIDITEKKRIKRQLIEKEYKLQERSIISMISSVFIRNSRTFVQKLEESLKIFGNAMKCDFTAILQSSKNFEKTETMFKSQENNNIYSFSPNEKEEEPDHDQEKHSPKRFISYWRNSSSKGEKIDRSILVKRILDPIFEDFLDNLSPNFYKIFDVDSIKQITEEEKQILKNNNIYSLLALPIFLPGRKKSERIFGTLITNFPDSDKEFHRMEIHMALEVSIVFGLAVKNQLDEVNMYRFLDSLNNLSIGTFIIEKDHGNKFKMLHLNEFLTKNYSKTLDKLFDTNNFNEIISEKDAKYVTILYHYRMKNDSDEFLPLPNMYKVRLKNDHGTLDEMFVIITKRIHDNKQSLYGFLIPGSGKNIPTPKEIVEKFNLDKKYASTQPFEF